MSLPTARLGVTDLEITRVGFGAWALGGGSWVYGWGSQGELNIGQLVRERHPGRCRLIGFTTYTGTVTAASDWDGPAERKWVRPALPGSVEELFHDTGKKEFMISFAHAPQAAQALGSAREETGHRGHLPPGHRTAKPLLPGPDGRPVRRGDPHRRNPGRRTAGTHPPVGTG